MAPSVEDVWGHSPGGHAAVGALGEGQRPAPSRKKFRAVAPPDVNVCSQRVPSQFSCANEVQRSGWFSPRGTVAAAGRSRRGRAEGAPTGTVGAQLLLLLLTSEARQPGMPSPSDPLAAGALWRHGQEGPSGLSGAAQWHGPVLREEGCGGCPAAPRAAGTGTGRRCALLLQTALVLLRARALARGGVQHTGNSSARQRILSISMHLRFFLHWCCHEWFH